MPAKRFLDAVGVYALIAAGVVSAETSVPASAHTRAAQAQAAAILPAQDGEDEQFAARGFVATWPGSKITGSDGQVVWDFAAHAVADKPAPDTVHPGLWRHARLLAKHGLFRVTERVWQVRGFDISNMTIIEGDSGLIVVDPLLSAEVARAALTLARKHLGDRPVHAVIYTHSHPDHFGGVRGVVDEADVAGGRVAIIAPNGFMEHAVAENLIAGAAMSRRAAYQFGTFLGAGPQRAMSVGIGPAISNGTVTLIAPTRTVERTGEIMSIDGVTLEFQLTPGTEAPAEMNFHLPELRVLCMAENANVTMHNVLTPRGALVRDAKAWADYLTESLRRYGDRTDVMVTSHGWPRWGGERIREFLALHRDAYKYLHDQSVRLMNEGYTGAEIAERLELPPALAARWFNRGYYGTMSHNSKAVYQRTMGWYDGNPAHLQPLPPEQSAVRYVEAMGGAARVKELASAAMARGEYRWAAELLDRVVFAAPADTHARTLLADAHTQLGYQAESAIWRNMYLAAAQELREGVGSQSPRLASPDLIANTPSAMLFDLLAVRVDPAKSGGVSTTVAFEFTDRDERHHVRIENGVLVHEQSVDAEAQATVRLPRFVFVSAILGSQNLNLDGDPSVRIAGDLAAVRRFLAAFTNPSPGFPIVTP